MREIMFEDVRPGDVARSNGKDVKVRDARLGVVALHDGEGGQFHWVTPGFAELLGISFWRDDRELPNYPGAWVSRAGQYAVRENGAVERPWLTSDHSNLWKSDAELLEWLGPGWAERTNPPARWVSVEPSEIRKGDYVRAERYGCLTEGEVTGVRSGFIQTDDWSKLEGVPSNKWFKREEGQKDNA